MNKRFLTTKEAAEYTGWSASFLCQARCDGHRLDRTPGPPYIKNNWKVMYDIADLDEWMLKYRKTS